MSQSASLGQEAAMTMPPPLPRQAPQVLVNSPGQHPDELLPSSDSDIEIDDLSPNQDGATAAWIEKQRQCPEPFLTAPELLLAKASKPHDSGGVHAAPAFASDALVAAKPAAAQTLATRIALGAQSSAFAAPPATQELGPLSEPATASLLAGKESVAAAHIDAQHRVHWPSGAVPFATCATANLGADVGASLKGSRHGHKPPLYPAKRGHAEDAQPRQQAKFGMSMFGGAHSTSGQHGWMAKLVAMQFAA